MFGRDGLEALSGLVRLETLLLNGCQNIPSQSLSHITGLTEMRVLDLSRCSLLSGGLAFLAQMKQLTDLDLSFVGMSDDSMSTISLFNQLTRLSLWSANIATGLDYLRDCPLLQVLDLTNCYS